MKDSFVYLFLVIGVVIVFVSHKVSSLILNNNDSLFFTSLLIFGLIIIPIGTWYYTKQQKDRGILTILVGTVFYLIISFCIASLPTLVYNLYNILSSKNNKIEKHICKITSSHRRSSFLGLRYQLESHENLYYYSGNDYPYNDISKDLKSFKLVIKAKKGIGETYILNEVELIKTTQTIE